MQKCLAVAVAVCRDTTDTLNSLAQATVVQSTSDFDVYLNDTLKGKVREQMGIAHCMQLESCSLLYLVNFDYAYTCMRVSRTLTIDIRVEGLETGSINTASRADSSMFLVLRPLIIFEMAACSNATAPFV